MITDRCADNSVDLHVHYVWDNHPEQWSATWADDCDRAADMVADLAEQPRTRCQRTCWMDLDINLCPAVEVSL
jgi:hypothetical protein